MYTGFLGGTKEQTMVGAFCPLQGGRAVPTLGPAVCLLLGPSMGTSVSVSPVTGLPSGGGLDSPPAVGGVCSWVPVTGLRSSPLGSLPVGTVPRTCASPETRCTLPISGESQPTSHLLRQCLPTAPQHEDLSAPPMAQLCPLHPTHSSPSAVFKGRRSV